MSMDAHRSKLGPRRPGIVKAILFAAVIAVVMVIAHANAEPQSAAAPTSTPTPKSTPDARWEQFHRDCATYGLAYEHAEDSAEDRQKAFGEANDPAQLTKATFFGFIVEVHEKVAPCLDAVERDLQDQGTLYKVIEVGGYREEREDRPYWFHQYGGAVDINPQTNPICTGDLGGDYQDVSAPGRCSLAKPYDLPQDWIATFERYGFYWGGNYDEGKDYMHFEWHGEAP